MKGYIIDFANLPNNITQDQVCNYCKLNGIVYVNSDPKVAYAVPNNLAELFVKLDGFIKADDTFYNNVIKWQ